MVLLVSMEQGGSVGVMKSMGKGTMRGAYITRNMFQGGEEWVVGVIWDHCCGLKGV